MVNGWIIDERRYEKGTRYDMPAEEGDLDGQRGYIVLRALTDAQALERESIGIAEWYYLDGQEPAVRRTYDLQAMTEYDYQHCIVDFLLPVKRDGAARASSLTHCSAVGTRRDEKARGDGEIKLVGMAPNNPEKNLELLRLMPPRLAQWVADCIADINMRSPQQRKWLEDAKKN